MNNQGQISIKDDGVKAKWQYVFNKGHKIVLATYRITDHVSDEEPLKWRLRDISVNILSLITRLIKDSVRDIYIKDINDSLTDMTVLLDIGIISDSFSTMNFELLKEEVYKLKMRINQIYDEGRELGNFDIRNLLVDGGEEELFAHITQRARERGIQSTSYNEGRRPLDISNRRQAIIDFLKGHGTSAIRDISVAVGGYSEKTIQRELSALVNAGVLEKEGERRWSVYRIRD